MCVCEENGQGDSEVDVASKPADDAHIIDVTDDFISSQGIIDVSARNAESSASPEAVPVIPSVTCTQRADTDVRLVTERIASVEDEVEASSSRDAEVAIVLGGMDTGGEIFDDCLVFRLTT